MKVNGTVAGPDIHQKVQIVVTEDPRADTLTPDFYPYRWHPITDAVLADRFVTVTWADGVSLACYDLWLLENAIGVGIDRQTREALIDPAELPDTACLDAVAVSNDGALHVWFQPDSIPAPRPRPPARFHPGWLRHVADGQHRPQAWLGTAQPWTTADRSEPPTHDGTNVTDDADEAFTHFVADLVSVGVARLAGCPTDHDLGLALGARLGAVRDTNFGPIWDVKALLEQDGASATNSTANTSLRLGPHTDLPTRETPPGFQFLHCVANQVSGGWSTMTDGLAVVEYLQEHHPDHYAALTTLNWVFFNRGRHIDHRWSGPIIDRGHPQAPLTLRAFYPVRLAPDMDAADMPRAYAAMTTFARVASDPAFMMSFPFRAGDVVAFDNRRILHGRQAFHATAGGHRHLRGFYIDHDEVYSYLRVANRRRAAADTVISPDHSTESETAHA